MTVGYSGTPLTKKLGMKAGMTVGILDEPEVFRSLLDPLPAGVTFRASLRGNLDLVIAFFDDETALQRRLEALVRAVFPDAAFWVAWPKQTSSLSTSLNETLVREFGLGVGVVDVKVCAIDRDWSGLKFVHRLENRGRCANR